MRSVRAGVSAVVFAAALVFTTTAATAATHKVNPGESIQDAIDAAAAGDTVLVFPGDYTEAHANSAAIRITKPLKLIAKSKLKKVPAVKVRILPGAGQNHGILVEPANPGDPRVEKVMIKGFTIEGFPKNGIWLRETTNFKIIGNESIENLENGIFPTLSAKGLVKKNVSYGSEDAALWVEASEDVRVIKNELYNSPTGLEVTVSKNILVKKNIVHDNTVGIGLYHPNAASLDPLGADDGYWRIEKNHVYNNNAANTAPPGSYSAALPSGVGILLLGVDNVRIKNNLIEGNEFLGIGVLDWCVATALAGPGGSFTCEMSPPIVESAPDNNEVIGNNFINNATNAPAEFAFFKSDILALVDEGVNNCYIDNMVTAGTFPANLSGCYP